MAGLTKASGERQPCQTRDGATQKGCSSGLSQGRFNHHDFHSDGFSTEHESAGATETTVDDHLATTVTPGSVLGLVDDDPNRTHRLRIPHTVATTHHTWGLGMIDQVVSSPLKYAEAVATE